jgi:HD superfamily phosphohydrolase YqeK
VDSVRETAWKDLDQACLLALRNTIQYLMSKQATIYPSTFYAYNDLLRKRQNNWRD